MTRVKEESDLWVACLTFLSMQKAREDYSSSKSSSLSYFNNLQNTNSLSGQQDGSTTTEGNLRDDDKQEGKKKKGKRSKSKSHKFSNINARAFISVI